MSPYPPDMPQGMPRPSMEVQKTMKEVMRKGDLVVRPYVETNDFEKINAAASAMLTVTVNLYRSFLGEESAAMMLYKVADDLAANTAKINLNKTLKKGK